ncbi:Alpha/Beta hydrolase protein [Leptodontidium sp. 2 PMI_412]|nr:Alpha/Beta hydrolase protein [Leptodontidium sp. 2 PMI_412]
MGGRLTKLRVYNFSKIQTPHPCSGTGQQYYQMTNHLPLRPHDNYCWDVASTKTVSHDGGGDCNGLANMLKYTLTKYNADTKKVFVTGTSSGAMMTNVMCAVYPDLIAAGSGYSGVAAGRLAGSPGSSPTTATPTCADGKINKTPFQWTSVVKSMYPTFNGTYSKIQLWHGTADNFVNYPKLAEEVTECSGVLGSEYTQMMYGDGTRFTAYSAAGVGHTVPVHESVDLKWFGIS